MKAKEQKSEYPCFLNFEELCRVGEDLVKWEEKIKTEMLGLIQQRMDHLELKLATYSFDVSNFG